MLPWLTVLATLAMIVVNGLANALPINGKTTGEISDGFDILFTPAGYVFSIWGLIYLALIVFTVVQVLPAHRDRPLIAEIRPWYLLNTAANASWILAWHHERFVLTLALMLVILGSLVAIYRKCAQAVARPGQGPRALLVRAPFSLYLGWITIATIANATVVLSVMGLSDTLGDVTWTLVLLAVATLVCAAVSIRFSDPVYAAVFVWAFVGIAWKHTDLGMLSVGALSLAGVCAVVGIVSAVIATRRPPAAR